MSSERWIRTDSILLTAGLLLFGYLLGDVILLVFAAILIAVGLDGLSQAVARWLPVTHGWALFGITLALTAIIVAALSLTAARLVQQARQVSEMVVDFGKRVQSWLSDQGVMTVVEDLNDGGAGLAGAAGDMAGHALNFGITAVGATSSVAILFFLTVFLAADPQLYRKGLVRIVPPEGRAVLEDTLSAIAHALRWWFLGQLASMTLLGVTVGLGLFLLGIELWFLLAVLTALLTFIPFIGPLIATVPIVIVGFAQGMHIGLIVLTGYIVIQTIEGNILVPMIQQQAVNLAPALLIAMQVLFSLVFGVAGLILAAPLTIVAMIAVQKFWVEHTLGETVP